MSSGTEPGLPGAHLGVSNPSFHGMRLYTPAVTYAPPVGYAPPCSEPASPPASFVCKHATTSPENSIAHPDARTNGLHHVVVMLHSPRDTGCECAARARLLRDARHDARPVLACPIAVGRVIGQVQITPPDQKDSKQNFHEAR